MVFCLNWRFCGFGKFYGNYYFARCYGGDFDCVGLYYRGFYCGGFYYPEFYWGVCYLASVYYVLFVVIASFLVVEISCWVFYRGFLFLCVIPIARFLFVWFVLMWAGEYIMWIFIFWGFSFRRYLYCGMFIAKMFIVKFSLWDYYWRFFIAGIAGFWLRLCKNARCFFWGGKCKQKKNKNSLNVKTNTHTILIRAHDLDKNKTQWMMLREIQKQHLFDIWLNIEHWDCKFTMSFANKYLLLVILATQKQSHGINTINIWISIFNILPKPDFCAWHKIKKLIWDCQFIIFNKSKSCDCLRTRS